MANQLDELDGNIREEGLDTHVIAKKIPVTVGKGSLVFEILLWILGIIPGVVFLFLKIKAKNYFQQLEQKIQHNASQIDNYLEQRVVVLQNCAKLLDRAVELDKSTFENLAKYRSGRADADSARNDMQGELDAISHSINVAFENYPDLRAHDQIEDAMKQNMYLQREITAARELYNDTVNAWNRDVFAWPTKQIVAARQGYTTRIPFIASKEIKEKATGVFF
jgi:LemA protein